jgi:hypothetical protein
MKSSMELADHDTKRKYCRIDQGSQFPQTLTDSLSDIL